MSTPAIFVPASNKLEAVTRMAATTGADPEKLGPGSKERKSVLVNLARRLDLPVDLSADKPHLGGEIATRLGAEWPASAWSTGQTITLSGLNIILEAAEGEVHRRAQQSPVGPDFVEPRSKLEAVTRMSTLTGTGPETLGPGSKERKSVLINLGRMLNSAVDERLSKPELGGALARALDVPWDESCWSSGSTVTLEGLSRLLRGATLWAERHGRVVGAHTFASVTEEARALLTVLTQAVPKYMDGRVCIREMHAAEGRNWAQDEWRGWYFEFFGLPALVNAFGGGPRKIGKTQFDYSLENVWDLKVHGAESPQAILNDAESIDEAAASGGVGFLALTGVTVYDDGEFREWQAEFRAAHGRPARPRATPRQFVRRSKPGFTPTRLDAFFFDNAEKVAKAREARVLRTMAQGRQTNGRARPPKYSLDFRAGSESEFHIASHDLITLEYEGGHRPHRTVEA